MTLSLGLPVPGLGPEAKGIGAGVQKLEAPGGRDRVSRLIGAVPASRHRRPNQLCIQLIPWRKTLDAARLDSVIRSV